MSVCVHVQLSHNLLLFLLYNVVVLFIYMVFLISNNTNSSFIKRKLSLKKQVDILWQFLVWQRLNMLQWCQEPEKKSWKLTVEMQRGKSCYIEVSFKAFG